MIALALLLAAAPLTTEGERSGFTRTGRYAEVEALCEAYPKRWPGKVRCEKFGTTPQGRPMLALVTAAPKGAPVVHFQGGIHAGEIDGKDAGFLALRELLEGAQAKGALSKVQLVFVPVVNPDGHERFGKNQRPNQVGPEEMGWRVTSHNLNLNRDWLKAEAPETQAMLRLLAKYEPLLVVDLHVTDGAKFQPDVSVTLEPQQGFAPALRAPGKALEAALFEKLKAQGHQPLGFYPSFAADDDPRSGFGYAIPPPRFTHGYWPLRDGFGILVETHSWKDYATRVKATHDVVVDLVALAAEHGTAWAAARAGAEPPSPLPVRFGPSKTQTVLEFPGYAYVREPSDVSGKPWIRYDETKPQVWSMPFWPEVVPTVTVELPAGGWVVPVEYAPLVGAKLALHGVQVTTLSKPLEGPCEGFTATGTKFSPTPYEGRQPVLLEGAWAATTCALRPGALFVSASQRRRALAAHLLEPLAPDSLAQWGFFNAHFEQKEYLEDYLTEGFAREQLKDPKVKAAFDAALADGGIAKDPEARLRFFSTKHPSFDAKKNVLPVVRVAKAP